MVGTALALEHARSLGDAAAIAALEALEPPPFLKATLEEFWAWEIRDLGRTFAVPVFVFQGENDFNTPVSCAREWVGEIRAPAKAFALIPDSGHNTLIFHPELLALLRQHLSTLG